MATISPNLAGLAAFTGVCSTPCRMAPGPEPFWSIVKIPGEPAATSIARGAESLPPLLSTRLTLESDTSNGNWKFTCNGETKYKGAEKVLEEPTTFKKVSVESLVGSGRV